MTTRKVTFTFRMDENDFRAAMAEDAPNGLDDGVTVKSNAKAVLDKHDPVMGYVHWSVD